MFQVSCLPPVIHASHFLKLTFANKDRPPHSTNSSEHHTHLLTNLPAIHLQHPGPRARPDPPQPPRHSLPASRHFHTNLNSPSPRLDLLLRLRRRHHRQSSTLFHIHRRALEPAYVCRGCCTGRGRGGRVQSEQEVCRVGGLGVGASGEEGLGSGG